MEFQAARAYALKVDTTLDTREISRSQSSPPTSADLISDQNDLVAVTMDSPGAAMHHDEAGRIHVFSKLIIVLALFALVLMPVLGGDPLARTIFLIAASAIVLSYASLVHLTRRPANYRPRLVGTLFQFQAVIGHAAAYYFGVFSPYAAISVIALYVFSLGSSVRHAWLAYFTVAVGYGLLAALIISGVIADRGLITAANLTLGQQIALQLCVQMLFLMAFSLARMGRRRTVTAVRDMETAVREIAKREALLHEARLALARAEQGGPGRYTDQIVGSFKLGVVIGRGAMGEIYEARSLATAAPAAVKLLHGQGLEQDYHLSRFGREARVAASLSARNLVRVLEISEDRAPLPYLAMERLVGQDLGHMLRERQALPVTELVDMLDQVSAGLEVARDAGIVHRDLKPQNLFLDHQDRVPVWKVLDFGVSKLCDEASSLTEGHVVGTPAYMAPEQASGGTVDHRADVYGLAVIAYRCLTGRPAFSGTKIPQLLYQVVHEMPVQPSTFVELPEDVAADLDAVLAIGMAKLARHRFASAGAFAKAFSDATRGELSPAIRDQARGLLQIHAWSPQ
jgi:serine/threonine-protein kinase